MTQHAAVTFSLTSKPCKELFEPKARETSWRADVNHMCVWKWYICSPIGNFNGQHDDPLELGVIEFSMRDFHINSQPFLM